MSARPTIDLTLRLSGALLDARDSTFIRVKYLLSRRQGSGSTCAETLAWIPASAGMTTNWMQEDGGLM
jgi:hypothetical protein